MTEAGKAEPGVDLEGVAARAYPIEAEEVLNAWIASRTEGVWTSPAGWWYAAWMHRQAEIERLRAQLAEAQAERNKALEVAGYYENAITWETTCLKCADTIDKSAVIHLAILAERDQLRAQNEAMRAVVSAAQELMNESHGYGCRAALIEGVDDDCTCGYREFRVALAHLDATNASAHATQQAESTPCRNGQHGTCAEQQLPWCICECHGARRRNSKLDAAQPPSVAGSRGKQTTPSEQTTETE